MKEMCTNTELEAKIDQASKDILVIHKKTDQNCKDISEGFRKTSLNHEELLQGIKRLEPLLSLADERTVRYLKEGVELKRSTDAVVSSWKNKAKTIAIFLGVIAVILTIANALRDMAFDMFFKLK
jgi:hypothetical protein